MLSLGQAELYLLGQTELYLLGQAELYLLSQGELYLLGQTELYLLGQAELPRAPTHCPPEWVPVHPCEDPRHYHITNFS